MKKRLTSLLLALLLGLAMTLPALAAFQSGTLDSVVPVITVIRYEGEDYYPGWGSAFFVGEKGEDPQYLVTNHHVIENFLSFGGGTEGNRLLVSYGGGEQEEAYVVAYDAEKDLALLRLASPTDKRKPLYLRKDNKDMAGADVYAVGYPGVSEEVINSVTAFGRDDATVTSGTVSRLFLESGTGRRLVQMDATIHSGNSGGPLVDENGYLVGVNVYSVEDGSGNAIESVNYAIDVEELVPILLQNNVPHVIIDPEPAFPWTIVIIAAAAALVIIIIIIVALSASKKKPKPVPPTPDPVPPPPPPQAPSVRSMSRQHNGMQVPVDSQGVLIGRSMESCKIVFQSGTPGVSARHCSVAWDAASGEFILTDLRSTYGTFLSNGQKLTPGVPTRLRPGDTFYLGERDNALRVELG